MEKTNNLPQVTDKLDHNVVSSLHHNAIKNVVVDKFLPVKQDNMFLIEDLYFWIFLWEINVTIKV